MVNGKGTIYHYCQLCGLKKKLEKLNKSENSSGLLLIHFESTVRSPPLHSEHWKEEIKSKGEIPTGR